ncbi:hypothetical protein GCM10009654_25450 [Streptomyces hebeiensis]|uniref:ABC transporter type 1 GsiC-like N-terminal domain-containing protein n=1 Tax=Streptomyces hebeiensis TaxID=229486 RepID=A0ABN1UT67_9ACTN
MRRYVIKRLAQAAGVLWAAYTVSFLVLDYLPGDPVTAMASAGMDSGQVGPKQIAALRHEYGFDKPVLVQYAEYLGRAVRGDFGDSVSTGRPVTSTLADALPQTLQLTGAALLLAVLLGGGLAVLATYTAQRWLRQLLLSLPPLGVSVPTFWVGLLLVETFSFRLHWFPAFGNDGLKGLVLPALTLAVPTGAQVAQVLCRRRSCAPCAARGSGWYRRARPCPSTRSSGSATRSPRSCASTVWRPAARPPPRRSPSWTGPGCPTRPSGPGSIRTNCPAACGNAP